MCLFFWEGDNTACMYLRNECICLQCLLLYFFGKILKAFQQVSMHTHPLHFRSKALQHTQYKFIWSDGDLQGQWQQTFSTSCIALAQGCQSGE